MGWVGGGDAGREEGWMGDVGACGGEGRCFISELSSSIAELYRETASRLGFLLLADRSLTLHDSSTTPVQYTASTPSNISPTAIQSSPNCSLASISIPVGNPLGTQIRFATSNSQPRHRPVTDPIRYSPFCKAQALQKAPPSSASAGPCKATSSADNVRHRRQESHCLDNYNRRIH